MLEIEQLVVDGDHDGQDHDPKGVVGWIVSRPSRANQSLWRSGPG